MEKERRQRKMEDKTRIRREGRDVEIKRGKGKQSCTNMKHEKRKGLNGWVVLLFVVLK